MNFRHIATQIGDLLKYSTTVNEIDRLGQSVLKVDKEVFPNSAITSVRAHSLYNWVMSLAKTPLDSTERVKRLIKFCLELTPEEHIKTTIAFLEKNNCPYNLLYKDNLDEFLKRNFHSEVIKHSQKLFAQGNYFHSVFESAKAYNKDIKIKSQSDKDGQPLMLSVWGCDTGVLKVTACQSQSDKDFQDGIKFISGGIMSAIRNPTAHEPAITWPIDKQDCLDILSLISFLYRQLDKAVYYK
ncbi:MAG: TIGR02391 family protein [Bacteroidetes bacterium GWF2_43_63]|nr:MAG: TIGR02391 family protein [Bacteroidetes bacterium GWE2_42_42]OFY56395.1 MAG: TIGR02391 family protein [Bacteroidetes bacterium GWF2_43_63]HBG69679.1 TIGR02391 family protein [Bacteroidales bacterium]HCB61946.1 TIGR02391 family protein [Bacteroidales bacterium]HCY42275.1 TIGR02391 family protein [Prolixibacteraceae bacterium]